MPIRRPKDFIRDAGPAAMISLSVFKTALQMGRVGDVFKLDEVLPALGEDGSIGGTLEMLEAFKSGLDDKARRVT